MESCIVYINLQTHVSRCQLDLSTYTPHRDLRCNVYSIHYLLHSHLGHPSLIWMATCLTLTNRQPHIVCSVIYWVESIQLWKCPWNASPPLHPHHHASLEALMAAIVPWYSGHHLSFFLQVNFHLIAWVDLLQDRSTHHLQNEVNSLISQTVLESWPRVHPCSGHWGHSNAQDRSPCPHRADTVVGEAGNKSEILSLANKARDCPALPFVSCSIVHSVSGHGSQASHTLGLCTWRIPFFIC